MLVLAAACESGGPHQLRVYNNPYSEVDWNNAHRLKSQHHDHIGIRPEVVLAYDAAGYDVVSLMDYSGNPKLPYAWRERIWPPGRLLPAETLKELRSIKLLVPSAEEVGLKVHITSPFVTNYIEGVETAAAASRSSTAPLNLDYQYSSLDEAFSLIRAKDGFPCIAHPWTVWYAPLTGSFCVEVYTAFAPASKHFGVPWFADRDPDELLRNWDYALQQNQNIWGIAVNDHFGPQRRIGGIVPADIRDSGKIIVLAEQPTIKAYRDAFVKGAFFAVQDRGAIKDRYPTIHSITVTDELLFIETLGTVVWTTNGSTIADGPMLLLTQIPEGSRYVRAEVRGVEGSVVYTQPFAIRPVGDVNGDYVTDTLDTALCLSIRSDQADAIHLLPLCEGPSH